MTLVNLPWQSPELNPNKRMSEHKRRRITAQRRRDAMYMTKAAKIKTQPGSLLVVQMHYRPERNWKLDAGNLCLDLKAAVDGITDAGVIPNDTPQYVRTPEPIIHDALGGGAPGKMWLELTWQQPTPHAKTREQIRTVAIDRVARALHALIGSPGDICDGCIADATIAVDALGDLLPIAIEEDHDIHTGIQRRYVTNWHNTGAEHLTKIMTWTNPLLPQNADTETTVTPDPTGN